MLLRKFTLAVSVSVLLSGCSDSDPKLLSEGHANTVEKACSACGKSEIEMVWMTAIIQGAKDDAAKEGFIYSIKQGGRVIFVYQPFSASCLGCNLYDCDGDRIDMVDVDLDDLVSKMTDDNLIYSGVRS